jgi:CDP-diacylglycerol--glycerol-3-phosphate 3-phosphatidyltransferase
MHVQTPEPTMKKSLPHLVILVRVALAFAVLGLFSLPHPWPAWAVVLTVVAIAMDGLDGWLARRFGVASELGAVLDITGDRIVEHAFWIYFAVAGLVPLWIPLVIVSRSFVVDAVRSLALARGKTPFGERTMQRSSVSRFLVASRAMRSVYGVAKVASFVLLGAVIAVGRASGATELLGSVAAWAVLAAVAICVVRAVPVLWDARTLLKAPRRAAPGPRRRPLPAGRG